MYGNKLAVAIKVNGKILRERADTVQLPLGTEYSIFVKNMNTTRASVKLEIDGQDMLGGDALIIPANSEIEVERSIVNGNLNAGNKFKFIERTAGIEDHRGIKVEDGLVRIEYEFEQKPATITTTHHKTIYSIHPNYYRWYGAPYTSIGATIGNSGNVFTNSISDASASGSLNQAAPAGDMFAARSKLRSKAAAPQAEVSYNATSEAVAGITVPGGISEQKFTHVADIIGDGVKHVLVMKLMGVVGGVEVKAPLTVSTKLECASCGKKNSSATKFCSECGTGLQVV